MFNFSAEMFNFIWQHVQFLKETGLLARNERKKCVIFTENQQK